MPTVHRNLGTNGELRKIGSPIHVYCTGPLYKVYMRKSDITCSFEQLRKDRKKALDLPLREQQAHAWSKEAF